MKGESMEKVRVLGVKAHVQPGGAMVTLTVEPQIAFKGTRIFMPASLAERFEILDIRVGYNSQMISRTEVPAEFFAEVEGATEKGRPFDMDLCTVGVSISFDVRNITDRSSDFVLAIEGTE